MFFCKVLPDRATLFFGVGVGAMKKIVRAENLNREILNPMRITEGPPPESALPVLYNRNSGVRL